jgi:hypothetical protein
LQADKSLEAYNMIPADERENTLVICYNYGQAGALNYYNRKKMPEAYAYNTDYIYWLPRLKKIQKTPMQGSLVQKFICLNANDFFTLVFYNNVEERKKKLDIF